MTVPSLCSEMAINEDMPSQAWMLVFLYLLAEFEERTTKNMISNNTLPEHLKSTILYARQKYH